MHPPFCRVQVPDLMAESRISVKHGNGRHTEVVAESPTASAQTKLLLPVPFGPITKFILGPGRRVISSYVMKLFRVMRTMLPSRNLSLLKHLSAKLVLQASVPGYVLFSRLLSRHLG